jgi:hypothetical protein
MIDIQPNYAAVKQGLIPITPQEKLKLEKTAWMSFTTSIAMRRRLRLDRAGRFRSHEVVWRLPPEAEGQRLLHDADQGPGGQLTPPRRSSSARSATVSGHGFSDITTRQTIQYHWLRIEEIPCIFAELETVGMTTSGACGDDTAMSSAAQSRHRSEEIIDATPQLQEVSRGLTDNREFSNLPRKYKISSPAAASIALSPISIAAPSSA